MSVRQDFQRLGLQSLEVLRVEDDGTMTDKDVSLGCEVTCSIVVQTVVMIKSWGHSKSSVLSFQALGRGPFGYWYCQLLRVGKSLDFKKRLVQFVKR